MFKTAGLLFFLLATPAHAAAPAPKPAAAIVSKYPAATEADVLCANTAARVEMARRFAARRDILNWGKMLFPEKFNLPFCAEMHGYFVNIRGAELTNTEAPRNHAKTTIKCFLIPLFQALEEPDTFRHYLNIQSTDEKALAVNRSIKIELDENKELREIYGNQIGERWTDQQFVLRNGVVFTAKSAGQSLRGIQYRSKRPDYIIVDDLYDEDDLNNPESTLKKNSWFWGTLYLARAKSKRCSIHVQGTAINNEDLLEELKKKDRWASKTFKAVKDWDAKIVLWPELNTFASLEADRADMGSLIFFREMQNERWDESTAIVKRAWLKDWEYDPTNLVFNLHYFVAAVTLNVDPSIGKNATNDATAMVLLYRTQYDDGRGQEFLIEGLWNEHLTMDKRVMRMQEIADTQKDNTRYPITVANIEGVAGFKDFVAEVKRRTNIPVKEIDVHKDKITVLQNKSKFFEQGKVKISNRVDPKLRDLLVYQLTTNYPKHDDLRDALLLGLDDKGGLWRHVV